MLDFLMFSPPIVQLFIISAATVILHINPSHTCMYICLFILCAFCIYAFIHIFVIATIAIFITAQALKNPISISRLWGEAPQKQQ